jgi:hypothetical protein
VFPVFGAGVFALVGGGELEGLAGNAGAAERARGVAAARGLREFEARLVELLHGAATEGAGLDDGLHLRFMIYDWPENRKPRRQGAGRGQEVSGWI